MALLLLCNAHINGRISLDILHVRIGQAQLLTAPLHRAHDS